MKSRSHRLPISESHDDWVDESWTVDCVCGVNFDDGEEMVDCDECGVWVHTRCSRYVKSEKSFACDKCKSKNNGGGGGGGGGVIGNDSEETEVAEFLVELPTKTLRIGNSNPPSVSSRRPSRLWTDIPMEERVHVQGIPGGDPGLFSGVKMPSVFGPELWKSAGYVPKKFNFRYAEFPCWNDGDMEEKKEEEIHKRSGEGDNQADNGAGVLFSLSKENEITLPTPVVDSIGAKTPIEVAGCHGLVSPKHKKKLDGENPDVACSEDSLKERSSGQPILLHCGKRKKETLGRISKDQNSKKKVRTYEKEGDVIKQAAHASEAASLLSSDAKQLEFSQDRGFKAVSGDIQRGRDVLGGELSDGLGECATNSASNEQGPEPTFDGISRERNEGDQVPMRSDSLSKCNNGVASLKELNESRSTPVKEEVRDVLQRSPDIGGGTGGVGNGSQDKDPLVVDVILAGPDAKKVKYVQDSNLGVVNSLPNKKMKAEVDIDDQGALFVQSSPLDGVKLNTMKAATQHSDSSANLCSESCKVIKSSAISSEDSGHKVPDGSRSLNAASSKTDKCDDSPGNPYQSKREPTGSEGAMGAKKRSSGLAHSFEVGKETLKSSDAVTSHSASYQRKVVVPVGKSTSTSAGTLSKFSDNRVATDAQNPTLTLDSRRKDLSETTVETVKEFSSIDTVSNEEKCGRPKKFVKEPSRLNTLPETSLSTKLSQTSDSKRLSSDLKDSATHSSSKESVVPNLTSAPGSGECASPPLVEGTSNVQNKAAGSVVPGKGDKFYQSGSHPSSRGNVASVAAPPSSNVPAALSDEELALLLHQELNSSPRVPRVPRMRHAGSLPQLTCPTASSMLMKRTSSSGGKDHSMSSRRKPKDFSRDSSHRSVEGDNQAMKVDRKSSSPDNRRRDSGCSIDRFSRRETNSGSVKGGHSMKMTNVSSSLSSSTDANGYNVSSSHPSSRNSSDDDPRMIGRPTNRTLPGLIAEIMSEGKRMTYEELCNAVLPHWPHLRKHNGERYAYSSHSQAVLDCLRNRSEWARLVDRGPKTSASRKRRKLDADSVSVESDDNDDSRCKNSKDVGSKSFESHQEDFPKGKRKARKRGRLALQGRSVVRRRRRNDVVSDDESESFSNSSEESMSSEEEIEGGNTSIVGNEASASSEEVQ